jgi:hypothetical protein
MRIPPGRGAGAYGTVGYGGGCAAAIPPYVPGITVEKSRAGFPVAALPYQRRRLYQIELTK